MKDPYKLSQSDMDSIEQGLCPRCQSPLELLNEDLYKCHDCNLEFHLLPAGHSIFPYECLECSHTMLGITDFTYEPMVCPKCNRRTLLRLVNNQEDLLI
jgi:DNA-directed RNA polymerase subunit RPC12/RpoP